MKDILKGFLGVVFAVAAFLGFLALAGHFLSKPARAAASLQTVQTCTSPDQILACLNSTINAVNSGSSSGLVGGTTPITGTCTTGYFLQNNAGLLACVASSSTIAFPQAVTGGVSGGIPYFSSTTVMSAGSLLTAGAVLLGGGAGVGPSALAAGTSTQVLIGGATPTWGSVNVATMATGLLPVANGGTGTATPAIVAGTGIAVSGSFPNQTITSAPVAGSAATGVYTVSTSDFSVTSSTAIIPVTTLISGTLAAGKTYAFDIVLFTTSASAGGITGDLNGGTVTVTSLQGGRVLLDASGFSGANNHTSLTATFGNTGITVAFLRICGTMVVNAGGTLEPRFAQSASNATASIVKTGSYMLLTQLN